MTMMKLVAGAITLLSLATFAVAGETKEDAPVLVDRWGIEHEFASHLTEFAEGKADAYVVVFLSAKCPIVTRIAPTLNELTRRYASRRVQFMGVYSMEGVTRMEMASHCQKLDLAMPVFLDVDGKLARQLQARVTPEAFVLSPKFETAYHGAIDDSGWRKTPMKNPTPFLAQAVDAFLTSVKDGKPMPELPEHRAQGCELQLPPLERALPKNKLTYHDHLAPIFQAHCVSCHYEGGIGGFALDSFDSIRDMALTVKREVAYQRMPPWQADTTRGRPVHGVQALDDDVRQMIVDWIDQGLVEKRNGVADWLAQGTPPANPPLQIEHPKPGQWAIGNGKPDYVVKMPYPFTLQASQVVEYQYFWSPNDFSEDRYIQEVELLPGDRRVVHHMQVFLIEKKARPKDMSKPMSGAMMMGKLNGLTGDRCWRIASFVPGDQFSTRRFPSDYGIFVPAGFDVVFEMHYTPISEKVEDRSAIGFVWRKDASRPKHVLHDHLFYRNKSIEIAPHASHVRTEFYPYFKQNVTLVDVRPHMHLRGADYEVSAVYPDGHEELLVAIPAYDFNWQRRYVFKEPVKLPAGSTLKVVGHWDNSRLHPYNPDANETVLFGEGSADEMSNLVVTYMIDEEAEREQRSLLRTVAGPIAK